MSADEEPTPAADDTAMADSQSNKRKASVDENLGDETAVSPKRVKLDEPEADTTRVEDGAAQEPEPRLKQGDDAMDTKVEVPKGPTPEPTKQEQIDPSPAPPRDASPKPSRSPTLSRRPSIPTPEPKHGPGSGPGADRGRKSISEQEKKRGQRLFGGLLSTLSQKPANSAQKKRQEVERRQQERAQQQRAEDDKRRVEKLAKLNHVRKIEQVKFDEQVMQTRHKNMLAHAHRLSTRCEPKLFYLPWKLTEAQETMRKEQILDATELIAKEAQQFKHRKEQRLKELGVTVGEPEPSEDANSRALDHPRPQSSLSTKSAPVISSHEKTHEKAHHDKDHDDPGYVMVEAEEDTVIY
ncbi:hypothetical protein CONLIGDRAFT_628522 [Coniochaeta ligniaria NRRL 30616]|uniref:Pinin/SDK/MemA protein domain-containing protein n=1 Tax=Coniochaeta ligniaria NRRL 30616 TaxID=1408157 RepID=A0A1J7JW32_9PEZI|nr:hypothetical protein CONLIGDRAFT_628522 [Coniochaeta ligniaria NRRL 30616]